MTRNLSHAPLDFDRMSPVIKTIIIANVVLYVLSWLVAGDFNRLFGLVPAKVLSERWVWQPFTYMFLHDGILHILFNMLWVRQLGPATAELYGAGRMVIIYILASVLGFAASSTAGALLSWMPIYFMRGAGFTVGASAGIFGLLGALVYYGRRSGSSMTRREALQYALMMGLFGLFMPGIDNWAHAGGFAGGYLVGRYLDPLTPETDNRRFLALKPNFGHAPIIPHSARSSGA